MFSHDQYHNTPRILTDSKLNVLRRPSSALKGQTLTELSAHTDHTKLEVIGYKFIIFV